MRASYVAAAANRRTQAVAELGQEKVVKVTKFRVTFAYLPLNTLPQHHYDVNCVLARKEAAHDAGLLLRSAQVNLESAQPGWRRLSAFSATRHGNSR